ncbi:MAG TPA: nitroreductase family protein [Gaiellaceae bacterium]|nr:nitroreductase family protein [Gaiellaceae bacterium]
METRLAIASRRETRRYDARPLPDATAERIFEAGRLAGSASNRQPWRFVVVEDEEARARLAECVFEPGNVRGAALVVAVVVSGKGPLAFDAGRAAQNMLLAAHDEGVGGSPNGMPDPDRVGRLLGLAEGERPVIVLTFGYPAKARRDPGSRTPEEWSERADRLPLAELVRRV